MRLAAREGSPTVVKTGEVDTLPINKPSHGASLLPLIASAIEQRRFSIRSSEERIGLRVRIRGECLTSIHWSATDRSSKRKITKWLTRIKVPFDHGERYQTKNNRIRLESPKDRITIVIKVIEIQQA